MQVHRTIGRRAIYHSIKAYNLYQTCIIIIMGMLAAQRLDICSFPFWAIRTGRTNWPTPFYGKQPAQTPVTLSFQLTMPILAPVVLSLHDAVHNVSTATRKLFLRPVRLPHPKRPQIKIMRLHVRKHLRTLSHPTGGRLRRLARTMSAPKSSDIPVAVPPAGDVNPVA